MHTRTLLSPSPTPLSLLPKNEFNEWMDGWIWDLAMFPEAGLNLQTHVIQKVVLHQTLAYLGLQAFASHNAPFTFS